LSPDGQYVAYIEQRWEPPAEKRNMELWVVNTKTSETQRLTFTRENEDSPKWSPDSRWIYFTASRGEEKGEAPFNKKTQVWRIPVSGGEPQVVTRLKDGIDAYSIAMDGKKLFYTVSDEVVEDEWKDLKEEHSDVEYGHGVENYSTLWMLDLVTWRETKLAVPKRYIGEFAASPDGNRIAMVTIPTDRLISNEGWSRVDIFDVRTEQISTVRDGFRVWRGTATGRSSRFMWTMTAIPPSSSPSNGAARIRWFGKWSDPTKCRSSIRR
jgi:Tol biopolymer transport system component